MMSEAPLLHHCQNIFENNYNQKNFKPKEIFVFYNFLVYLHKRTPKCGGKIPPPKNSGGGFWGFN